LTRKNTGWYKVSDYPLNMIPNVAAAQRQRNMIVYCRLFSGILYFWQGRAPAAEA